MVNVLHTTLNLVSLIMLGERKKPKVNYNKFVNVVKDLIILEELGFVEDHFHRWVCVIYDQGEGYSKKIIASGDSLYLEDRDGIGVINVNLTTLWDKNVNGAITKRQLMTFINLINEGNVKKKDDWN